MGGSGRPRHDHFRVVNHGVRAVGGRVRDWHRCVGSLALLEDGLVRVGVRVRVRVRVGVRIRVRVGVRGVVRGMVRVRVRVGVRG